MKKINDDAKALIRSYVEMIEEYLKSTCKMHPNEIDSLLTEINDFIFIRSDELAKGDSVSRSDALKAMEECGSPSEICEQYLESVDEGEESNSSSTPDVDYKSKGSEKSSTHSIRKSIPINNLSQSLSLGNYLNQLRRFKIFAFYRFLSFFTYLMLILSVAMIPFGYGDFFNLYEIENLLDTYMSITLTWILVSLFFEGWLIHKWKKRLSRRGFVRKLDDGVLIIITRVCFLIIALKASLLPIPWRISLIFPLLIVLQTLLERHFKTHLWIHGLSPNLLKMANSIDNGKIYSDTRGILQKWKRTFQNLPMNEKVLLSIGGSFFLFSLLFPWLYGWSGSYWFSTERLIPPLIVHLLITLLILIALMIVNFSVERTINLNYKLSTMSFWVGRLLGLRSFLMLNSYSFDYYPSVGSFLNFLLLSIYLLFEATLSFQRHLTLKQTIVSGLQYLGQDSMSVSSRRESLTATNLSSSLPLHVPDSSRSLTRPSVSEQSSVSNHESTSVHLPPLETPVYRHSQTRFRSLFSILYTVFAPVFLFIKAIFIAFLLLLSTIYEIILFLLIILTGTSVDGSYIIPTYSFTAVNSNDVFLLGGFTIWSWYLLGALAAQIFVLVVIEWFQFVRKKPDGLIIIFFRNFSRILLLSLLLGSLYQQINGDLYAIPRIIICLVFFVFMELTALKIRLERRKWGKNALNQLQKPLTPEQQTVQSKLANSDRNSA